MDHYSKTSSSLNTLTESNFNVMDKVPESVGELNNTRK